MNKIGLFCFIKDEIDFIEDFINHHQGIFDQITFIDTGSSDGTLEVLENTKNIILIKNNCSFDEKENVCTQIMKQSDCDILVPLDADEKIIYDGEKLSKDPKKIREYFQNLPITGAKYRVKTIYEHHPDNDGWWGIRHHPKIIFPKSTFMYTDAGFHRGRTTIDNPETFNDPYYWRNSRIYNDPIIDINISYFHYHFKSKEIWIKNTEKKLKQRLGQNWNNMEFLQSYAGKSIHLKFEYINYINTGEWCSLCKSIFIDESKL